MKRIFLWLLVFTMICVSLTSANSFAVDNDYKRYVPADSPDPLQKMNREKRKPLYREGELLVRFKAGFRTQSADTLHKKHGAEKIKEFPSLNLHKVKVKKGMSVEDAIGFYLADPNVEYAEPNYKITIRHTPDDPFFNFLWGLYNTGQTGGTANADINAPAA